MITTTQSTEARWGLEALSAIRSEFTITAAPGYCDSITGDEKSGPVFNWGVGVLLSAMNAAAKADQSWKPELRRFVDAIEVYWNPAGPTPGYDVLPMPKETDRYYDDNAWMVLALVESSTILNDDKLLDKAQAALDFVLSGEDDILKGGIYWREKEKKSKNTCSNGPAAAACLALYTKTRDPKLLQKAKQLYAWTKKNLQDPADSLFWDSKWFNGEVDKTKWSYNTALMIRSAADLFRITGEPSYAADAEAMAKASEAKWIVDGRLADAGRFAHLLAESWTYAPSTPRRESTKQALKWLHENGRNAKGLYGGRFDREANPTQLKYELIDTASAARAFLTFR